MGLGRLIAGGSIRKDDIRGGTGCSEDRYHRHVALRPAGIGSYRACAPFHDHPRCAPMFHCFGWRESGDDNFFTDRPPSPRPQGCSRKGEDHGGAAPAGRRSQATGASWTPTASPRSSTAKHGWAANEAPGRSSASAARCAVGVGARLVGFAHRTPLERARTRRSGRGPGHDDQPQRIYDRPWAPGVLIPRLRARQSVLVPSPVDTTTLKS